MSTIACETCHGEYATRKDGTIRKHPCAPGNNPRDVALPWGTAPLTANQQRRMHHMAEASQRTMLSDARWAIRAAKPTPLIYADVTLHWRMPDRRQRDGDGAAPTLKVVLDALVHEGILPEDSWVCVRHSGITTHPPVKGMPGAMWLSVEPAEGEAP